LRLELHPDRFFPVDPQTRAVARRLFETVERLPIVSPHGHTDARWFADNGPFPDPAALLIQPDHYVFRMLYSAGVPLEALGLQPAGAPAVRRDPRAIWRLFAENYRLFRGTPTRLWHDYVYAKVFGLDVRLGPKTADHCFDVISAALKSAAFRPRALFERFGIEVIATTEGPLDSLEAHHAIASSGWPGRVITAYRPDPVIDPDRGDLIANIQAFAELTGEDALSWKGYLAAHRQRRADFKAAGATSTDHGHPTASTADLPPAEAEALFRRVVKGRASTRDAEQFRAQMLTEMARMSLDDGLVMQIHPGSFRNHSPGLFARFGRDMGADIPTSTDYVHALKPLLDRFGDAAGFTLIVFTLDETSYSRELAPLAGVYPALKLGPAWWFHDSPEGMRRFREQTTETAGFYNTVGFNDDTRAFLSIPARHDLSRRIDCGFLARLVVEHRLDEDEAFELAPDLAYGMPKKAYRL
jgi:glucuronate isomerase